jgi:hypothetical protein
MEPKIPGGLEGDPLRSDRFSLEVEAPGLLLLPLSVRERLRLEPGALLSLTRNVISLRLDPYQDLLDDLHRSVREPNGWSCLEPFLQKTLTAVGADGTVYFPRDLLELRAGDLISLEVVTEGLRHALYLYRNDG